MSTAVRPPLAGLRVIESSLLGPSAITTHLADLGAEVIKIEPPSGDYIREMTWPIVNGVSLLHLHVSRGKQSVTLDLKKPEGVEIYRELVKRSDVVVEAMRPGSLARLGLGYDDIRAINPRVIYASATGFGASGRYAGKPAYDDLIQGLSGIAAIAPDAWGGEPRYMPLAIADRTTGLYLANAISAALCSAVLILCGTSSEAFRYAARNWYGNCRERRMSSASAMRSAT